MRELHLHFGTPGPLLQPAYSRTTEGVDSGLPSCCLTWCINCSTAHAPESDTCKQRKFMDMWRGLLAHICIPPCRGLLAGAFPWKHCQKLAGSSAFFCRSCRSGCQNWTIVFDTWLMYQGLSTGSAQESVSHSCQGTFKVAAISAPAWESHSSLTPRIAKHGASLISSLGSGSTFAVSAKSSLHCEPAEFAVVR